MDKQITKALAECREMINQGRINIVNNKPTSGEKQVFAGEFGLRIIETMLKEEPAQSETNVIQITIADAEMQRTIDWLEDKLAQTEEALEKAQSNKCPRCHSTIQDGKRVCIVCGMPLGKVAV